MIVYKRSQRLCVLSVMLATALGAPVPMLAQVNTYDIIVSNDVSPERQSATIFVLANFDTDMFAFKTALFDFTASDKTLSSHLGGQQVLLFPDFFGNDPGTKEGGNLISDILVQQVHFPPNILALSDNPIALWMVTWNTFDFTPRRVTLETITHEYSLYTNFEGYDEDFVDTVVEGFGYINVVPAPSAAGALGILGLVASRRRR